jgi:hypothetical protein
MRNFNILLAPRSIDPHKERLNETHFAGVCVGGTFRDAGVGPDAIDNNGRQQAEDRSTG